MRSGSVHAAAASVAVILTVTGCSSRGDTPAGELARQFYAALATRDGAAACRSLAPRTLSELEQSARKSCAVAVLDQELLTDLGDPRRIEVFGTLAQVRYAGETTFLSRFSDGWKVIAAGCVPQAGGPYECQVEGG